VNDNAPTVFGKKNGVTEELKKTNSGNLEA
jgi:hypothetical protein